GAGQIEFLTFAADSPDLVAAIADLREAFREKHEQAGTTNRNQPPAEAVGFPAALAEFPNTELATRLFTTIENGRIDFLLRTVYRGSRRDLDFVRGRLMERRPNIADVPPELLPFELLFQLAICGGATPEAQHAYPTIVRELEQIMADYIFREDATVADSLIATRHVYEFFVEQPNQSDSSNEETGDDSQTSETSGAEGSQ